MSVKQDHFRAIARANRQNAKLHVKGHGGNKNIANNVSASCTCNSIWDLETCRLVSQIQTRKIHLYVLAASTKPIEFHITDGSQFVKKHHTERVGFCVG